MINSDVSCCCLVYASQQAKERRTSPTKCCSQLQSLWFTREGCRHHEVLQMPYSSVPRLCEGKKRGTCSCIITHAPYEQHLQLLQGCLCCLGRTSPSERGPRMTCAPWCTHPQMPDLEVAARVHAAAVWPQSTPRTAGTGLQSRHQHHPAQRCFQNVEPSRDADAGPSRDTQALFGGLTCMSCLAMFAEEEGVLGASPLVIKCVSKLRGMSPGQATRPSFLTAVFFRNGFDF